MKRIAVLILAGGVLAACWPADASIGQQPETFTLYRSSLSDKILRMHVATFDAAEGREYNRENCQIAAGLFRAQPGVKVEYWCEPGRFNEEGPE